MKKTTQSNYSGNLTRTVLVVFDGKAMNFEKVVLCNKENLSKKKILLSVISVVAINSKNSLCCSMYKCDRVWILHSLLTRSLIRTPQGLVLSHVGCEEMSPKSNFSVTSAISVCQQALTPLIETGFQEKNLADHCPGNRFPTRLRFEYMYSRISHCFPREGLKLF